MESGCAGSQSLSVRSLFVLDETERSAAYIFAKNSKKCRSSPFGSQQNRRSEALRAKNMVFNGGIHRMCSKMRLIRLA
jgi:hypothetical protein